jgi:PAS domain S-box-containing protein
MTRVIRPLGLKLTALLVAGILLSYGLLTYLIVRRETSLAVGNSLHFAELAATTTAELLTESMLSGKPEETARYLKTLSQKGNLSVSVFDRNGIQVFNGRRQIDLPIEVLTSLKPLSVVNEETARFFMPLRNEKRCRRCHGNGFLRGIVVVDIPLQHMKEDVAGTEKRLILYGLLVIGLGILGTVILVNRMITRPIGRIGRAIRVFMEGGPLPEVQVSGNDELTEVAEAFNSFVLQLKEFHGELERLVQERTDELMRSKKDLEAKKESLKSYADDLRKVSAFSNRFVRRDRSLSDVLQRFVEATRDELGYRFAEIYLLDREADELKRFVTTWKESPAEDGEKLFSIFYTGEIFTKETENIGMVKIYVPIYTPKRGNCYEINECNITNCPCFGKDLRCWQIPHTKCDKIHGPGISSCRQCIAFPLKGLLVLGSSRQPDEHDLGILEVISSEISLISEIYDLIRYERNMVNYLMDIHNTFVKTRAAEDVDEVFTGIAGSSSMSRIFPGFALWLREETGDMVLQKTNLSENLPVDVFKTMFEKNGITKPLELYDIRLKNYYSVILCPLIKSEKMMGVMGFFFTHKGFLLPEERAVALVLSQNIAGDIENIHLRKGLEDSNRELQHQKGFIEDIIKSINSGILVVDENDVVVKANPYALKALGYVEEDITGAPIDEAVPGLRSLHEQGENEGVVKLASGRELYLGFSFSPFRGSEGERGNVILFRDLTEIIELRNELRRKKYFSTIGEMASLVAHEVRNPIFAISSIARILLQKYSDGEDRRFAESILKESERLNILIEDLLNYGRPLSLNKRNVQINRLISESLNGLGSFLQESNCSLDIDEIEDDLTVTADPDRIKQVLYNLIKNSVDAGASHISIRAERDGRYRKISIKDNGRGIRPDDMAKVMKPFFTTKKAGTGLGLPICKKIVEGHGGKFNLSSEEGKGTEVIISLRG